MTCDVYESELRENCLVVVPAGAATTAVPASAGLGDLRPVRIAVEIDEVGLDAPTAAEVTRELEERGYFVATREDPPASSSCEDSASR